MNGNTELLSFVYQNAQMGVETIDQLMGITQDAEFKRHLQAQYEEYKSILSEAKRMFEMEGKDEKGLSAFEKIRTYLMISLETLGDKSTSHIAEMLTIGSTMGVIQAIRNIRKYEHAQADIQNLMKRLLRFEEDNITQLKKFI